MFRGHLHYSILINKIVNNMKKYIYLFVIACLTSLLGFACGRDKAQQKTVSAVPVTVYKVIPESAQYYDTYPATVTPLNQVELRSEVSGYLTDINFKDRSEEHTSELQSLRHLVC